MTGGMDTIDEARSALLQAWRDLQDFKAIHRHHEMMLGQYSPRSPLYADLKAGAAAAKSAESEATRRYAVVMARLVELESAQNPPST